jgi:hypothetical protein
MFCHARAALAAAILVTLAAALGAQAPAAVSGATPASSWSIALSGARKDSLSKTLYEKMYNAGIAEKTVDKKGVKVAYRGVPLFKAIAMVDGEDAIAPFSFDEGLWKSGYDVTIVASDGYTATFSTKDIAPDALILAVWEAGSWIDPMVVGDGPKSLWVKDVASIETSLAPNPALAASDAFKLELDINGAKAEFAMDELEASPLYLEQKGGYTTSAGTHYEGVYGGVRLLGLIERYAKLTSEDSVSFVAMDGYEMTYPGSLVLDEKEGVWILAFKLDGERIPKDPGYIRTIKVGPGNPNIDGHLSVRMVKRVVVKQKDFKDFSLSLGGKMEWNLDRSTVQSCVSCHKRTVTFEQKGKTATYTGFPAYLALGYVDDPKYAPHKQDKSIPSYESEAAKAGYKVKISAADGFSVTVDSRELDHNDDVIIAMYKDEATLPDNEFPLAIVWDKGAKLVPAGLKAVRMIASIKAIF